MHAVKSGISYERAIRVRFMTSRAAFVQRSAFVPNLLSGTSLAARFEVRNQMEGAMALSLRVPTGYASGT